MAEGKTEELEIRMKELNAKYGSTPQQYVPKNGSNAKYLTLILDSYNLPRIDITDPEQIRKRMEYYFDRCIAYDAKPGIVGLSNALGITRQCFFKWQTGKIKNKDITQLAQTAKGMIEEIYEQYMINGEIRDIPGIFLMKNNFEGYADKQEIVVTPNSPLEPNKDENELKELYSANDFDE